MCRFLEITKSTLTQWPIFLLLIGNLERNAGGLQTSTTVLHTPFLRRQETLQKLISWWHRWEMVDTTTNAWLSNHICRMAYSCVLTFSTWLQWFRAVTIYCTLSDTSQYWCVDVATIAVIAYRTFVATTAVMFYAFTIHGAVNFSDAT